MLREKKIQWTEGLLMETFNLKREFGESQLLNAWLRADQKVYALPAYASEQLESLRARLFRYVDFWNEEDLKMNFISPILLMVDYYNEEKQYRSYYEKEITGVYEGVALKTKSDFMIAHGIGELARNPYFCFHEYKRDKKHADDPTAQVLLGMLIAQSVQKTHIPIYGAYIIGRNWYFMVMSDKKYTISSAYDATDANRLAQILAILLQFKFILDFELVK